MMPPRLKPLSLQPTLTRRQKVIYVLCVAFGVMVVTLGWSLTTLSAIRSEVREAKDHAEQTIETTQTTSDRNGNPVRSFRTWVQSTKKQLQKNIEILKMSS